MLAPIVAFTPRRYQSVAVEFNGRSSECGDHLTRKLLFEAVSRRSQALALKDYSAAVGQRSGFWKVRVTLACKLTAILHRM